jgi:hypothetical protein
MWAEKRPHEWLGGALGVLGLAPSALISQIKQKVLKGYDMVLRFLVKTNWKYFENFPHFLFENFQTYFSGIAS